MAPLLKIGPIMFHLYINDNVNISDKFKYVLFADETNIFFSWETTNNVENIDNIELNRIQKWLYTNKLHIK